METRNKDLKGEIRKERPEKGTGPRWWFPDLAVEPEEWRAFRKDALPLEKEHLELRTLLRDAEAALRAQPENEQRKARVEYLRKRLEELDKKAPWISSGLATEMALWGVPESCG